MADAVDALSLHLKLSHVLRQLREVQIKALDAPSYRLLEFGATSKAGAEVVISEVADFMHNPAEHEITKAVTAKVAVVAKLAMQWISSEGQKKPQLGRRARREDARTEAQDDGNATGSAGGDGSGDLRSVSKIQLLEKQIEELRLLLASSSQGAGTSAAAPKALLNTSSSSEHPAPSSSSARPDMTAILAAARDKQLRTVNAPQDHGADHTTPQKGGAVAANAPGAAATGNLHAHLLTGLQRLKRAVNSNSTNPRASLGVPGGNYRSPGSDDGGSWSPVTSPVAGARQQRRVSGGQRLYRDATEEPGAGAPAPPAPQHAAAAVAGAMRAREAASRRKSLLRHEVIVGVGAMGGSAGSTPASTGSSSSRQPSPQQQQQPAAPQLAAPVGGSSSRPRKRSLSTIAVPLPQAMHQSFTLASPPPHAAAAEQPVVAAPGDAASAPPSSGAPSSALMQAIHKRRMQQRQKRRDSSFSISSDSEGGKDEDGDNDSDSAGGGGEEQGNDGGRLPAPAPRVAAAAAAAAATAAAGVHQPLSGAGRSGGASAAAAPMLRNSRRSVSFNTAPPMVSEFDEEMPVARPRSTGNNGAAAAAMQQQLQLLQSLQLLEQQQQLGGGPDASAPPQVARPAGPRAPPLPPHGPRPAAGVQLVVRPPSAPQLPTSAPLPQPPAVAGGGAPFATDPSVRRAPPAFLAEMAAAAAAGGSKKREAQTGGAAPRSEARGAAAAAEAAPGGAAPATEAPRSLLAELQSFSASRLRKVAPASAAASKPRAPMAPSRTANAHQQSGNAEKPPALLLSPTAIGASFDPAAALKGLRKTGGAGGRGAAQ